MIELSYNVNKKYTLGSWKEINYQDCAGFLFVFKAQRRKRIKRQVRRVGVYCELP